MFTTNFSSTFLEAVFCSVATSFNFSHWADKWPLLFIIVAVVIAFDLFVVWIVFNKNNPNWRKSKANNSNKDLKEVG